MIPLGQKNTLAKYMILSGNNNRPPMLDKDLYYSCKSRMELYIQNKEHGRMMLESVENGPLIWPTIEENGLHAYLEQHELYLNEVRLLRKCNQDPLVFVANQQMTPPHFSTYQSSYNNPQLQQQFLPSQTSSNPRNHATIQDGRVTVQQVYRRQGERHMARKYTQLNRPRNETWYKDKAMLGEAQEAGQILGEEKLTFLADPGVPDVLMANISNYGSDIISEVPHSETYLNDMENQSVHAMQDFEQSPVVDFPDNEIHSDSNIISYS
nr:hypothetical protein [Tanacetum cinerariifolium]